PFGIALGHGADEVEAPVAGAEEEAGGAAEPARSGGEDRVDQRESGTLAFGLAGQDRPDLGPDEGGEVGPEGGERAARFAREVPGEVAGEVGADARRDPFGGGGEEGEDHL